MKRAAKKNKFRRSPVVQGYLNRGPKNIFLGFRQSFPTSKGVRDNLPYKCTQVR